jgi:hypothetical protein
VKHLFTLKDMPTTPLNDLYIKSFKGYIEMINSFLTLYKDVGFIATPEYISIDETLLSNPNYAQVVAAMALMPYSLVVDHTLVGE